LALYLNFHTKSSQTLPNKEPVNYILSTFSRNYVSVETNASFRNYLSERQVVRFNWNASV